MARGALVFSEWMGVEYVETASVYYSFEKIVLELGYVNITVRQMGEKKKLELQ